MDYPELNLNQLRRMTDDVGIFQHGKYNLPLRAAGYCTDDNARGLIAAARLYRATGQEQMLRLAETYLGFLHYAQIDGGRFHNFMNYDRTWADNAGSEDSFGRAVWGLGVASAELAGTGAGILAQELLREALPQLVKLGSPRAWAFSLLGLAEYLKVGKKKEPALDAVATVAQKLVTLFKRAATAKWGWFEDRLAYANGVLPAALFAAANFVASQELMEVARESLAFLTQVLWQGHYFKLVGCQGWYIRGGDKAQWDEQPEDASCLVLAYCQAYRATGKKAYVHHARRAVEWFYGRNAHGLPLVDMATGGCYDGLTAEGINENQGAESLLAHLLGRLELAKITAQTKEQEVVLEAN